MIARSVTSRGFLHLKTARGTIRPHWLPTCRLYSARTAVPHGQIHPQSPKPQGFELTSQTTIIAPRSSSQARLEILKGLERTFRISKPKWTEFVRNPQALVILGTPEFVEWLEDDELIRDVLAKITRPLENQGVAPIEVDILCACVDGLAPSIELASSVSQVIPPPQGLSFLHGRSKDILPGLWDKEDSSAPSNEKLSTLTFSGGQKHPMDLTVPLANTLFTTGKYSTLLASRWRATDGSFTKVKFVDKRRQIINVFDGMHQDKTMMSIPAIPLTPNRRITEGLGNIIRKLDFGAGGIGPASRELESAVHAYIKTNPMSYVWAFITPKDVAEAGPVDSYNGPFPVTKHTNGGEVDQLHPIYIARRILRGDILCRVLSGGGGWGNKQGLLSLDPQTTYYGKNHVPLEFSHRTMEEQQTSALGILAEPGAFIQFFTTKPGSNEITRTQVSGSDPSVRSVVVGTIPSPVDGIAMEISDDANDTIEIQGGHFGCVSQAGLYIHKDRENKEPYETKVDLPYSFFYSGTASAFPPAHPTEIATVPLTSTPEPRPYLREVDELEDAVALAGMTAMNTLVTAHLFVFAQSIRDDSRNMDSEWVHDKFDDNSGRRPARVERRYTPERSSEPSAKLLVENLHYDLTEDDLDDLFNRIGTVLKLSLVYDRAGRSEGIAYVTYENPQDAKRAIREFDGANAKGQPIRLISIPSGPSAGRRNPFNSVVVPGRSLADRITMPPGRSRSDSPVRHSDVSGPAPSNVDRYVPGRGTRSRSPQPRRRDGRRPGARRERGERRGGRGGGGGGERIARDGRPKKTQEQLDAEMEDYFGGGGEKQNGSEAAAAGAPAGGEDDIEMVE
ncbi:uncharacterized protein BP5553_06142 [Venustampulla echinocandica]|uniref:RRM domain-containing protein n=1 Tax=Venustampulla echinocandica TaxID=2656787 RepID=A0A370TMN3_9HELO|nr:uncharacterized protein BP5553_06142 [Venustampulla echinocandica]RDL36790.1 hypothetical protein BP5553_06142 [Venustampulla echinocandica]